MRDNLHPLVNAVLYADIFNFALTKEELLKYAIGKCTISDLDHFLKNTPNFIFQKDGLICLNNKKESIDQRKKREEVSKEKIRKAKNIANILKIIPSVKFIGLSGAVAVKNAEREDDIDFFIITQISSLWKTRLLVTVLLSILGQKRNKNALHVNDKICLNMFMSEEKLGFNKNRHDLFTAHEIAQVVPLIDKGNTYKKFLSKNLWVTEFLPNALKYKLSPSYQSKNNGTSQVEKIAKIVQLWYMKKNITIEEIENGLLAFHPVDYRSRTLKEYEQRRKKYGSI